MRIPTEQDLRTMPMSEAQQHIRDVEGLVDRAYSLRVERDASLSEIAHLRALIFEAADWIECPPDKMARGFHAGRMRAAAAAAKVES